MGTKKDGNFLGLPWSDSTVEYSPNGK